MDSHIKWELPNFSGPRRGQGKLTGLNHLVSHRNSRYARYNSFWRGSCLESRTKYSCTKNSRCLSLQMNADIAGLPYNKQTRFFSHPSHHTIQDIVVTSHPRLITCEQGSWEANNHNHTTYSPHLVKPKVSLPCTQNLATRASQSQTNPVHNPILILSDLF